VIDFAIGLVFFFGLILKQLGVDFFYKYFLSLYQRCLWPSGLRSLFGAVLQAQLLQLFLRILLLFLPRFVTADARPLAHVLTLPPYWLSVSIPNMIFVMFFLVMLMLSIPSWLTPPSISRWLSTSS
jgi:hypothetical protein